jgi:hypothetical protein
MSRTPPNAKPIDVSPLTDARFLEMASAISSIIAACRPHLAGHSPTVQSAALADLVACWLAGHYAGDGDTDELREVLLQGFVKHVQSLVPTIEAEIRRIGDEPPS